MRYHVDITSPESVARQLNVVNPDGGVPTVILDKATGQYLNFWSFVTEMCQAASEIIAEQTTRSFVPFLYDMPIVWDDVKYDIRRGRLPLDDDLLVVSELGFGDLTIDAADYRLFPSSSTPVTELILSRTALSGATFDFGAAFSISGTWGYVTNLAAAWSLAQAAFSCTSNETEVTVTPDTAVRYDTLSYLRVESEYMQITAIDLETDTLTVTRGVNGTTAATHSAVPLYRFNVKQDVALAATRLAAFLYQRRTDAGSNIQLPDGSILLDQLPLIIRDTINRYRPVPFRSVPGPR